MKFVLNVMFSGHTGNIINDKANTMQWMVS